MSFLEWLKKLFEKKPKEKALISVCDSGNDPDGSHPENARLATEWCPYTHMGQYLKDHGPTKVCDIHHAPPPPPDIKKCKNPWPLTNKLVCFSGTRLCGLSTKDGQYFKESDLPKYYDLLVEHGINSERNFSYLRTAIRLGKVISRANRITGSISIAA